MARCGPASIELSPTIVFLNRNQAPVAASARIERLLHPVGSRVTLQTAGYA
jgi:hypothetical protein